MAYPGAIKSFTQQTDLVSTADATDVNETYDEVEAIETELGTNPKSIDDTVTPEVTPADVADVLDQFATQIKAITGKSDWYTGPATTLEALQSPDGWIDPDETWTYVSATTFTVPTDLTAKYQVGTKLKLTQTTAKYFHVESSSYGAPNTTVTVVEQTDYTLADAAITSPFYSYQDNPEGFPQWFTWAPTLTGFSADPTTTGYRFTINGRMCTIAWRQGTSGTSDATNFKISLPINSFSGGATMRYEAIAGLAADNDVALTSPVLLLIEPVASVVDIFKTSAAGSWTASGGKRADGMISYAI